VKLLRRGNCVCGGGLTKTDCEPKALPTLAQCVAACRIQHGKKRKSMLTDVRGEEHLLLRFSRGNCIKTASCTLLSSLTDRVIKPQFSLILIRFHQEDPTLSQHTVGMHEFDELIDMTRLLVNLWEAAQRLPEGSERQDAFKQISGFQRRVAALVTRAL
jgi:hypothetical protein